MSRPLLHAPAAAAALAPVLVPLPRSLPRRARVERFRAAGRQALERAAERAGAPPLRFRRDEDGAPVPEAGWRWSLTNAEGLVAAVVSRTPIGIDAEPLDRPRRETVTTYLRERDPLGLEHVTRGDEGDAALRLWTAFEAACKLAGVGVSGLPETALVREQDSGSRADARADSHADVAPTWRHVRVGERVLAVWTGIHGGHVLSLAVEADPQPRAVHPEVQREAPPSPAQEAPR